jgi:hypothetical protein
LNFMNKKTLATLAIVMLTVLVSQSLSAHSAEITFQEKSVSFMTNVANLDLATYDAELTDYSTATPKNDDDVFREEVRYTLKSNGNNMGVSLQFMNKTLTRYDLYTLDNSELTPIYNQPKSSDPLTNVKDFLERYQTFSGLSTIDKARDSLNMITEMKSQNVTMGSLKLAVIVTDDNSTFLMWTYNINGLDFAAGLSIRLRNGVLDMFDDKSSLLKIGNSDINTSKEDAVATAWSQAKTFTSLNISLGDSYKTVPFSLKEEPKTVSLIVSSRSQEPFTMYPLWYVEFSAEAIQYGVNGAEVGIWADTGEVAYARLAGYQGIISTPGTTSTPLTMPTTTPSMQAEEQQNQSTNKTNTQMNELLIALVASMAALVIVVAFVLTRRKH